tara:strand:+ start:634 stop:867 length:234 start_codon:yes stop_codon:yes gene_type:complete
MESYYDKTFEPGMTDMARATELVGHIVNPCSAVVDGVESNLREFWIYQGQKALETFEDPLAIRSLQRVVDFANKGRI